MLEEIAVLPIPESITPEQVQQTFFIDASLLVVTKSSVLLHRDGWRELVIDDDTISSTLHVQRLLLLGMQSGAVRAVSLEDWRLLGTLRLSSRPILVLRPLEATLFCLAGNVSIIALNLPLLCQYFLEGNAVLQELARHSGTYEGNVVGEMWDIFPLRNDLVKGWPVLDDECRPPDQVKMVIAGTKPMVALVALSPLSEALPDPLDMAADFLSSTVGAWFRPAPSSQKDEKSPRIVLVERRLPRAFLSPLITLDDTERTLSRILPSGKASCVLFDAHYGRALKLNVVDGLLETQIKGLRGCALGLIPTGRLLALHLKRNQIQLFDLSGTRSIGPDHLELDPASQGSLIGLCTISALTTTTTTTATATATGSSIIVASRNGQLVLYKLDLHS